MTTKNRSAIFSIIAVVSLAVTSGTITVASVSAQNSTDRQFMVKRLTAELD
jgi:hypothetical protein